MAHPLFDRHNITAERNALAREDSDSPVLPVLDELTVISDLLRRMLAADRSEILQLCVTDREPMQTSMANFPLPGCRRFITRRTGFGGTFSVPLTTPTLILPANEGRLGGQIVCTGTTGVTLSLTVDLLQPGAATPLGSVAPQIFLFPSGGSWDLRLGNVLWAGNVIATATAATTVTVAEV